MISLVKLREQLLTDPEVKAEYDRLGPVYEHPSGRRGSRR